MKTLLRLFITLLTIISFVAPSALAGYAFLGDEHKLVMENHEIMFIILVLIFVQLALFAVLPKVMDSIWPEDDVHTPQSKKVDILLK